MSPDLQAPIMPVKEDARYKPLLAQARTNWEEHNLEMVKELQQKGQLEKCLESAVEQAIIMLQQCEVKGKAPDQARELRTRTSSCRIRTRATGASRAMVDGEGPSLWVT